MQRVKEAAGKRSFLNNWVAIVGDCEFTELLDFYQRKATVIGTNNFKFHFQNLAIVLQFRHFFA